MENIAIDLLWVRPGKVGGTESFIRNLLDGLRKRDEDFCFTLLVSKDNAETFRHYEEDPRYHLLVANVNSAGIAGRILWQNFFQNRFLKKYGIRKCFEPVYCKPWLNGGIKYTCVIHDLQAYHYPEYHPFHEVAYSRLCWRMDAWNASQLIAISNWVKEDIEQKYGRNDIQVIYNPILIKIDETEDFEILQKRYGIEKNNFYYTVAQMIPHKNVGTLLKVIEKIKATRQGLPDKLVISGINGNWTDEMQKMIREKNLENNIILTGFISNAERNSLYKNCYTFLFPSVFEGFGMPPIEAMIFGTRVVTTKCTSIPEVTQDKAVYVDDPYDVDEWIDKLKNGDNFSREVNFEQYSPELISRQYLMMLEKADWTK